MTDVVSYRLDGDVAVLIFDDGKANVFNDPSIEALHDALDRAEREAKAVVLVGRPGRFSAGFDLSVMSSGVARMQALVKAGVELFLRTWELPIPVVVACTGHAVAAGAMLLLTADYAIGVEGDWKIALNETDIGMPLPIAAIELARARLDPRAFTRATLHAELYDGDGAVEAGYLDAIGKPNSLLDDVMVVARRLTAFETSGYPLSKHRARRALADHVRSTLDDDVGSISMPSP